MKIAVVGPAPPLRGGIALFTHELAHQLRERHQVELFTFSRQYPRRLFPGNAEPAPTSTDAEVRAHVTIDSLNPLSWRRTARHIVAMRPDVLILQWWTPYWLPLYASLCKRARVAGIPVLTFAHQFVEPDASFVEWFVTRRALARSDGLVVTAEEEVGMARRVLPGIPVSLAPLPALRPAPLAAIGRDEARQRLGLPIGAPIALFFGFVRRYKGLKHLLEAVALTREVQLVVAGEFWENRSTHDREIERLGVRDQVRVVDRYLSDDEVELHFAAADVAVLPYVAGTQTAVGAMALERGVPLIATTVGGFAELIRDGETGLLVAPADSAALGEAIDRYFSDDLGPGFRAAIVSENGQRSWAALVNVIEEVFDEVVRRRPRGGCDAGP